MIDSKKRVVSAMILAALVVAQVCAFGAKKATLTTKLGNVQRRIKQVKYKIHVKESQKRTELGKLAVIESTLGDAQDRLTTNKIEMLDAQTDLAATVHRLAVTKRQLARRQELLRRRVVEIYEGDDLNYLDVVLGSANMWTFLSRSYYLQQILNADTTLISQIRALKASIEADRARQARRVAQIGSLQVSLVSERDEVASIAGQKQRQVDAIEHDKTLMERALAEMEAEEQAIEEQIRRIQSTPEGQRRLAKAFRGRLMLPCSGRITCPFGYRNHPITGLFSLHTGIDIGVSTGTPLHAAADGTVVKAGWNRAYGYMVVIEHNGGYSTLYGHNSRLLVSVGDDVKQGQVIAKSGSTGFSTGPHVHYQVMYMGKPINPGRG